MKLLLLSSVLSLLVVATPAVADMNRGPIYQNGKVWVPLVGSPEENDTGLGYWAENSNAKADEKRLRKEIESVKKSLDIHNTKE